MSERMETDPRGGRKGTDKLVIPIEVKCKCREDHVEVTMDDGQADFSFRGSGVLYREGDSMPAYVGQALLEEGCIVNLGECGPRVKMDWEGKLVIENCDGWVECDHDHLMGVAEGAAHVACPSEYYVTLESIPEVEEEEETDKPEYDPDPRPPFLSPVPEGKTYVEFDHDAGSATWMLREDGGCSLGTFYLGGYLLPDVAQALAEAECHIELVTGYIEDQDVYEWKYDEECGLMVKMGDSWEDDISENFREVVKACETPPNPTACQLVLGKLPEQPKEDGEQPQEDEGDDTVDPRLLAKVKMGDGKVELTYRQPQETMALEEVYAEGDDVSLLMAQVMGELGCWISLTAGSKSMILRYQGGYWETWNGSKWNQSRDESLRSLSVFHFALFLTHSFRLAKVPNRDMEGRIYITEESDVDIEWRNPLK